MQNIEYIAIDCRNSIHKDSLETWLLADGLTREADSKEELPQVIRLAITNLSTIGLHDPIQIRSHWCINLVRHCNCLLIETPSVANFKSIINPHSLLMNQKRISASYVSGQSWLVSPNVVLRQGHPSLSHCLIPRSESEN